ncbi:MAG: hypothetical protein JSR28_01205 [Proteobacteria bacterium]|nr:hypothetical protein [Pseudomonadota bacterium]MDE2413086.1 hypothetical protein [Sphingomonadales bacterium]
MTAFTAFRLAVLLATIGPALRARRRNDRTVILCAVLFGARLLMDLGVGDVHPLLALVCHLGAFIGLAAIALSPERIFTLPMASAALLSFVTLALHTFDQIGSPFAVHLMLGAWDLVALVALATGSLALTDRDRSQA